MTTGGYEAGKKNKKHAKGISSFVFLNMSKSEKVQWVIDSSDEDNVGKKMLKVETMTNEALAVELE